MRNDFALRRSVWLSVVIFSVFVSCSERQYTLDDLEWLNGQWRSGKTVEIWTRVDDFVFEGAGYSVSNEDTTLNERLRLIARENRIYYVADVAHNDAPVPFELVKAEKDTFQFVNPEHDFPKSITYIKQGDDSLDVLVANESRQFTVHFKRKK